MSLKEYAVTGQRPSGHCRDKAEVSSRLRILVDSELACDDCRRAREDQRFGGSCSCSPFIAYPGMAEIVARDEQTLSRRVPALAATFGRP